MDGPHLANDGPFSSACRFLGLNKQNENPVIKAVESKNYSHTTLGHFHSAYKGCIVQSLPVPEWHLRPSEDTNHHHCLSLSEVKSSSSHPPLGVGMP